MYAMLLKMWKKKKIPKGKIAKAVTKGWITEAQKEIIINTPQKIKKINN